MKTNNLIAWQIVAIGKEDPQTPVDADQYPTYIANREKILRTLAFGLEQGSNALSYDELHFVVALGEQDETGKVTFLANEDPRVARAYPLISTEMSHGKDSGMLQFSPDATCSILF